MAAASLKFKKHLALSLVLTAILMLLTSACSEPVSQTPITPPTPTPTPASPTSINTTPASVPTGPNQPPIILKIERSEEGKLRAWHTTTITCVAEDPDGDKLTYIWSSTATPHSIQGQGRSIGWVAPGIKGDYTVQVKVIDGRGGEVENSITIVVCCCDNC